MQSAILSASLLKRQVERKAYAYGVSPVVSSLLGEYVVDLLRTSVRKNAEPTESSVIPSV